MRFMLFNVAVIAALFYLFFSDRGDLTAVAERVQQSIGEVLVAREERGDPQPAEDAVAAAGEPLPEALAPGDGNEDLSQAPQPDATAGERQQPQEQPTVIEAPGSEEWALLLAEQGFELEEATESAREEPQPQQVQLAVATDPSPAAGLLPAVDPAVAQRRAEVLDGIDIPLPSLASAGAPAPAAARPAAPILQLADGEALMSNEERLKQLYVLAEEMELLFVQKLAR